MVQAQSSGNSALTGLIYLVVALICAGLSAWSTFHGLELLQRQIAGLIAAVIFLALFLCHYVVLRQRQSGAALFRRPYGLIGPLVLLLFVTILSASSSFAYFYNLALRDSIALSQSQLAGETFESNAVEADAALRGADSLSAIRDSLELEFNNLRTEVFGAGRDGFGELAMGHVREIERIMAEDARRPIVLPTFPAPGAAVSDNQAAYDRLRQAVDSNLEALATNDAISKALEEVTQSRRDAAATVASMRSVDALTFEERVAGIEALAARTVDMERIVNTALSSGREPVSLAPVSSDGIGLTNIVEVYRWAFGEGRFPGITAMALFLALLLDLLPFLMAMVLFRPEPASPRGKVDDRGQRGGRGTTDGSGSGSPITGSTRWS